MTVLLFYPQFHSPIRMGTKTHTCRRRDGEPCDPGDDLSLRHWTGMPYRSTQGVLLDTYCVAVDPIAVDPTVPEKQGLRIEVGGCLIGPDLVEPFAIAEGFETVKRMVAFWRERHKEPFEGYLIEWLPPGPLQEVLDGRRTLGAALGVQSYRQAGRAAS